MSLFLGGPTNERDPNMQEPDGFASLERRTQISWELLTYLRHTLLIYTDTRNKRDDTLTLCKMNAGVNVIHHAQTENNWVCVPAASQSSKSILMDPKV